MKHVFTKQDLITGDITVARNGELGIVLKEHGVLVYQNVGVDDIDNYDDQLKSIDGEKEFDIMAVYRDTAPSFKNFLDGDLVFERHDEDGDYVEPVIERTTIMERVVNPNAITIMTQAFYGNRTCTEIRIESLDRFILGYQSDSVSLSEPIDRTIVNIPNTNNLVLIYNKYQEEEHLAKKDRWFKEDGYVLKPLASIPELNLELYSRCIVCRMNEKGELGSLQHDDYEKFMKYLAA